MGFWHILLGVLFLVICFLLIIIVLLQKGKGGGLGAAFGGMGSSAFGTRTGDVFTWVTIVLTGLFLLLAIGASLTFRPEAGLVEMPQFDPEPMPISETIPVRIFCGTKGSTIRYTTDGADPTSNSPAFEKAVRVEPGTTLKARGFREKWTPSPVAVGEYSKADAGGADGGRSIEMPATPEAPATPATPATPAATAPAAPATTVPAATAPAQ
jgi:preprotein translocase subunit SecG